jgi:hypothetical protein
MVSTAQLILFQQDGVPPCLYCKVRGLLNLVLPQGWIGCAVGEDALPSLAATPVPGHNSMSFLLVGVGEGHGLCTHIASIAPGYPEHETAPFF